MQEPHPIINPRESILQVILNALSGNFYSSVPAAAEPELSHLKAKTAHEQSRRFEDLIEQ